MSVCYNSLVSAYGMVSGFLLSGIEMKVSIRRSVKITPLRVCAAARASPGAAQPRALLGKPPRGGKVGPGAGSSLWQRSISCSTSAIYGGEELSWMPCLSAKPLFPLEQAPASALPAAWLGQARARLAPLGFPFKKEAASPTSGLVRSSESWFMMQIMVWRWCFFFPSAEYLGSIFS